MFKGINAQRLVAVFLGGWLIFNHDASVAGLPVFPAALFLLWAALIALLAWFMERPGSVQPDE